MTGTDVDGDLIHHTTTDDLRVKDIVCAHVVEDELALWVETCGKRPASPSARFSGSWARISRDDGQGFQSMREMPSLGSSGLFFVPTESSQHLSGSDSSPPKKQRRRLIWLEHMSRYLAKRLQT